MFHFAGVGLSFFLALLLLSKKQKSVADKVLAGWLFVIGLHLLLSTFLQLKWYPQFWGLDLPLPLVHGPFLYIYTIALTRNHVPFRVWAPHIALPIAFYIYLLHFFILPTEQKIYIYENRGIGYEPFMAIRSFFIPLSGILYVIVSSLALRAHRRLILEEYADTDRINLLWLQYLIGWIGVIWIFVIIGSEAWIFGTTVVFVFFIGFFGLRQANIFHSPAAISNDNPTTEPLIVDDTQPPGNGEPSKPKYHRSGLSTEESESLHANLTMVMRRDKLFRESELSLSDLARKLETPPNYLSQVINEREGKNFYDYVNTLRVEEFLRVVTLPESKKLTLFAVAQECGFNSKSSFNRYFKKMTGKAPSEYVSTPNEGQSVPSDRV